MLSTLIVGFGFSATTFHLPFLKSLSMFSVDGVVTSTPDKVQHALPKTMTYSSLDDALNHHRFDLVVITTPNHLHYLQTKQSLEAGCHVLVEKPFTLCSEEAAALVSLANKKDRKLCVFHNRRFDGDFLTIKKMLNENVLGNIKRFESRFDRFRPQPRDRWRENAGPGSGIFWDLGPHLIDQALQLFGPPLKLSADIMPLRDNAKSDDNFDMTLYYADHIVKLGSSSFQAGPTLRFDVQGTKGNFRKFHLDPQEDQLRRGRRISDSDFAKTADNENGTLFVDGDHRTVITETGAYAWFYSMLADAVINGSALPADAKTVVSVIKTIEYAIQASKTQRTIDYK